MTGCSRTRKTISDKIWMDMKNIVGFWERNPGREFYVWSSGLGWEWIYLSFSNEFQQQKYTGTKLECDVLSAKRTALSWLLGSFRLEMVILYLLCNLPREQRFFVLTKIISCASHGLHQVLDYLRKSNLLNSKRAQFCSQLCNLLNLPLTSSSMLLVSSKENT